MSKSTADPPDLTVMILREIRDEMRAMRAAQGETNERLDATNERLERLEKRQSEDAIRLASEVVALAKAVGQVRDLLSDRKAERLQLVDHEKRLRAIERKIA